jgi:RNA polymerase sigma-70 factor (ECF subfamily)
MEPGGHREASVRTDAARHPVGDAWARWRGLADDDEAQELVARVVAARRDGAAARASLERLLVRCRPLAKRIAGTYVRSEADAADMVQEALLSAARHLPGLRDPRAFPHWFAALAHNACRQWLRRERRHRQGHADLPGDPDEPAAWELLGFRDAHADAAFDAIEARDRLVQLLRLLPPRERGVVARAYLDDRPQHEIARREGVSSKAVESLLYRGIRRLRAVATQCGAEPQELALWCPRCGQRRLVARLEPGNGPEWPIHVRAACPGCAAGRSDVGLALARYPTLEGALVDGWAALGAELRDVVRAPAPRCACGGPVRLAPGSDLLARVTWSCERCRAYGVGGLESVAAGQPAWRAFWLATPRMRLGPARAVGRDSEARIELTAWDTASGRTATLALARGTLAVLALEVGG